MNKIKPKVKLHVDVDTSKGDVELEFPQDLGGKVITVTNKGKGRITITRNKETIRW